MDLASPASLLGHIFAGDTVDYAHIEAARFVLACFALGSILGLAIALVKEQR